MSSTSKPARGRGWSVYEWEVGGRKSDKLETNFLLVLDRALSAAVGIVLEVVVNVEELSWRHVG